MNAFVIALGMAAPVPFCLLRRKRYGLSYRKLLLIFLVVAASGILGASLGSLAGGGNLTGKRLYGLMLLDTITLLLSHRLFGLSLGKMGDFIAAPVMAGCSLAKLDCIVNDCCYGIVIKPMPEIGRALRFPSALVELIVWAVLTFALVFLERSKKLKGLMWPIAMIAFGVLRFVADYFRGSASDRKPFCPGISLSQLWCIVAFVVGVVLLGVFIARRKNQQKEAALCAETK